MHVLYINNQEKFIIALSKQHWEYVNFFEDFKKNYCY